MKYLFSWRSPETYLGIRRRKWWRFWEHDKIVEHHTETRYAVQLDDHEVDRLQRFLDTDASLLRKLMARGGADNAYEMQLEMLVPTPQYNNEYIATAAVEHKHDR